MDKYEKDGKVGVIVSEGYGAGWSSEGETKEDREWLCMDKTLVEMALSGASSSMAVAYILAQGYSGYVGYWSNNVEWVKKGEKFHISCNDGWENIVTEDELMTA